MEELLRAFSSRLTIQKCTLDLTIRDAEGNVTLHICTSEELPVSDDTRKKFEKALLSHINSKELDIGSTFTYSFDVSEDTSSLLSIANRNLQEVLSRLPKLPDGSRYNFPSNTFLKFIVFSKTKQSLKLIASYSDWIDKRLFE